MQDWDLMDKKVKRKTRSVRKLLGIGEDKWKISRSRFGSVKKIVLGIA